MSGAEIRTGTLIHAIRGPILLITVGVLFALDNLGSWSFTRTWPVILIIVGVLKLFERATRQA
jgi:hypothetical protein